MIGYLVFAAIFFLVSVRANVGKAAKRIRISRDFTVEDLPDEALSPEAAEFFNRTDQEAAGLGYTAFKTFKLPHFSEAGEFRHYRSPQSDVTMTALMSRAGYKSQGAIAFNSTFVDGSVFETSNMGMRSALDLPPNWESRRFRLVNKADKLLSIHLKALSGREAEGKEVRAVPESKFMQKYMENLARLMDYQVERGVLGFDRKDNVYLGANRYAARLIAGYYNPFEGMNGLREMILGPSIMLAIFIVLPLVLNRLVGPSLDSFLKNALSRSLDSAVSVFLLSAPAFIIGTLCGSAVMKDKKQTWAFIMSLPAALMLLPRLDEPVVLSMLALFTGLSHEAYTAKKQGAHINASVGALVLFHLLLLFIGAVFAQWTG